MSLPLFLRAPLRARSGALLLAAMLATMLALSACGGGGGGGSAAPPVASVQAPSIATQPASQTVAVGQSATFSVAATGDGLGYQWQRNGADIAGATAASYVLANAQAADDGSRFTVVVRNGGGSVSSAAAILQVKVGQLSLLAGALGGEGQMDGPVGRFREPTNIAVSPSGELWVNDRDFTATLQSRKIVLLPGTAANVATLPPAATWATVVGAVDAAGNRYENWYLAIHKTTPAGVRTLLAGNPSVAGSADGAGIEAGFKAIAGMAVDAGGTLYVADRLNATIRKISPAGAVTTLAGSAGLTGSQDGAGAAARFRKPGALALDKAGNIYVDDDRVLRRITPAGVVTTLATVPAPADGLLHAAEPNAGLPVLGGLAVGADGSVYVLSGNIRRVSPDGVVTDFTGAETAWSDYAAMNQDAAGNMYVADPRQPAIFRVTPAGEIGVAAGLPGNSGSADGVGGAARFAAAGSYVDPMFADAQGNLTLTEGTRVRRMSAGGAVSTLPLPEQDGKGGRIAYIVSGMAYGRELLAWSSGTLRTLDGNGNTTGVVATATSRGLVDGPRNIASMSFPGAFLADPKGNIYFRDTVWASVPTIVTQPSLTYIRRIGPDGAIVTLPGSENVDVQYWIADRDGNILYSNGNGVQRMSPDGASTTLYARPADSDPAVFAGPLAIDRSGNIYLASGNVLRKITPAGAARIVAGTPEVVGVRPGPLPASLNRVTALTVGDDGLIYLESENAILTLSQ